MNVQSPNLPETFSPILGYYENRGHCHFREIKYSGEEESLFRMSQLECSISSDRWGSYHRNLACSEHMPMDVCKSVSGTLILFYHVNFFRNYLETWEQ